MANKRDTLATILLIAGLLIGGLYGYYNAQKEQSGGLLTTIVTKPVPRGAPLTGRTIALGYISSSTTSLETGKPYHEQIIEPALNEFASLLGYDVSFKYLIDDATGQAQVHLEKIMGFKSAGYTIIEGGGWSSQAQAALDYCNANDILLWSTSSTSPTLAIADDYLYRMCPPDSALAPVLANVMWDAGVKTIVIFQRGDSWADGIVSLLVPIWQQKGGDVAEEKIRYPAEATEFNDYLNLTDSSVADAVSKYDGETQRVGVLMLTFGDIPVILQQAANYTNLYNVHWWVGDTLLIKNWRVLDESAVEARHVGVYYLKPHETITSRYKDIESRYVALTSQPFAIDQAYSYDIALVLSTSVLEAQSQRGIDVVSLQYQLAMNTFGVSGWCRVDEFGDRFSSLYDVWIWSPDAKKLVAQYDHDREKTIFDVNILGYMPIGP